MSVHDRGSPAYSASRAQAQASVHQWRDARTAGSGKLGAADASSGRAEHAGSSSKPGISQLVKQSARSLSRRRSADWTRLKLHEAQQDVTPRSAAFDAPRLSAYKGGGGIAAQLDAATAPGRRSSSNPRGAYGSGTGTGGSSITASPKATASAAQYLQGLTAQRSLPQPIGSSSSSSSSILDSRKYKHATAATPVSTGAVRHPSPSYARTHASGGLLGTAGQSSTLPRSATTVQQSVGGRSVSAGRQVRSDGGGAAGSSAGDGGSSGGGGGYAWSPSGTRGAAPVGRQSDPFGVAPSYATASTTASSTASAYITRLKEQALAGIAASRQHQLGAAAGATAPPAAATATDAHVAARQPSRRHAGIVEALSMYTSTYAGPRRSSRGSEHSYSRGSSTSTSANASRAISRTVSQTSGRASSDDGGGTATTPPESPYVSKYRAAKAAAAAGLAVAAEPPTATRQEPLRSPPAAGGPTEGRAAARAAATAALAALSAARHQSVRSSSLGGSTGASGEPASAYHSSAAVVARRTLSGGNDSGNASFATAYSHHSTVSPHNASLNASGSYHQPTATRGSSSSGYDPMIYTDSLRSDSLDSQRHSTDGSMAMSPTVHDSSTAHFGLPASRLHIATGRPSGSSNDGSYSQHHSPMSISPVARHAPAAATAAALATAATATAVAAESSGLIGTAPVPAAWEASQLSDTSTVSVMSTGLCDYDDPLRASGGRHRSSGSSGSCSDRDVSPQSWTAAPLTLSVAPPPVKLRGTPGRGCVGLYNLGNTCFMNSILQSLNTVPELVAWMMRERKWHAKARVAPSFADLMTAMWSAEPLSCVSPNRFLQQVARHDSRWGEGRQQDSQEFLHSLLEALQSDCNRITGKPAYKELEGKGTEQQQAEEAHSYSRSWHDSVVDDIFGGQLQSTIQCSGCSRRTHCFDPFLDLSLPIPNKKGHISVEDCLEAFGEQEQLKGAENYNCSSCKRCLPATKRLQIYRYPRVLVLTLKRFTAGGGGGGLFSRFSSHSKNSTAVALDAARLDLSRYCNPAGLELTQQLLQRPPVYELIAVSNHSGSLGGGHYTAQGRGAADNQWYEFNDSSVYKDSPLTGSSSSAYVLFYRQLDLPSEL